MKPFSIKIANCPKVTVEKIVNGVPFIEATEPITNGQIARVTEYLRREGFLDQKKVMGR